MSNEFYGGEIKGCLHCNYETPECIKKISIKQTDCNTYITEEYPDSCFWVKKNPIKKKEYYHVPNDIVEFIKEEM
jgi:aspartyl/asparaginyl-tRNA synthetase